MNNKIRFHVYEGNDLIQTTDWTSERTRDDAPNALQKAREEIGGKYKYRIERTGDSREPNTVNMIQFRIKIGDVTFLSKLVPESEKDELLATLKSGEDVALVAKQLGLESLKSFDAAEFTEVKV